MTQFNLDEFNPKRAELQTLADKYVGLTIAGIEDKEGFERVHKAQMELRAVRVDIEKRGKAAREEALAYQKAVIALEKELVGIISPVEDALKAEKEKIEAEKERIKKEAEEKERSRVQSMIDQLASVGYSHDPFALQVMDSETFAKLLADKTEEFRVSEEKRIADEAKAKADAEELEKLRAEKAAMEEEKRKLEEEKSKIQREKELEEARKQAAEKAAKETEERIRREAEEKAAKETADAKRLAEVEAYRAFLAKNGVTKDTEQAGTHKVMKEGNEIRVYALVDTFLIPA